MKDELSRALHDMIGDLSPVNEKAAACIIRSS